MRNCWCNGGSISSQYANSKENEKLQLELNQRTIDLQRAKDELQQVHKIRQLSSEDFRRLFDENSQLKQMVNYFFFLSKEILIIYVYVDYVFEYSWLKQKAFYQKRIQLAIKNPLN